MASARRCSVPRWHARTPRAGGCWYPLSAERASYSPLVFLLGIALLLGIGVIVATRIYRRTERRAPAWDCGFARQDARMQDSAEGFGQPIRHIFGPFFRMRRELPSPLDASPVYRVRVEDRFWSLLYLPLARSVSYAGSLVGRLQQGRIAVYLLYSFLTLLVLLVIVL
jgi:hydrogenase-4 component B